MHPQFLAGFVDKDASHEFMTHTPNVSGKEVPHAAIGEVSGRFLNITECSSEHSPKSCGKDAPEEPTIQPSASRTAED